MVVIDLTWEMVASSVISRPKSVIVDLNAIVKSTSIEGSMRGTILFQWPWKCMMHLGVIWIVSSRNVPIFSMIND